MAVQLVLSATGKWWYYIYDDQCRNVCRNPNQFNYPAVCRPLNFNLIKNIIIFYFIFPLLNSWKVKKEKKRQYYKYRYIDVLVFFPFIIFNTELERKTHHGFGPAIWASLLCPLQLLQHSSCGTYIYIYIYTNIGYSMHQPSLLFVSSYFIYTTETLAHE